jgi:hypothetical protein
MTGAKNVNSKIPRTDRERIAALRAAERRVTELQTIRGEVMFDCLATVERLRELNADLTAARAALAQLVDACCGECAA